MHILLAILGIMGAAAFWWYRFKYMSEAAGEGADARGLAGLGGAIVDHADHDLAGVAVDDRHAGPAPFS